MARTTYPSEVSDEAWALVAPSLKLMTAVAPQREHNLREVFNGLRWMVRAGAAWRLRPHDPPPWHTAYQQSHRWRKAGVFEAIVHAPGRLRMALAGHYSCVSCHRGVAGRSRD